MTIVSDVINELVGMFIADARLTVAILALVALVAALNKVWPAAPLLGGCVLMLGCVAVLVESVARDARRRAR
jgi:hypothetical protein